MESRNKYTVIIPTMYYHAEQTQGMIDKYEQCSFIEEILIINNSKERKVTFAGDKVREMGVGINLFVNPSWKLGVTLSFTNNVILANDDITITGSLKELFEQIERISLPGKLIGPSKHCYPEKGLYQGRIELVKSEKKFTHGFGAFMILTKKDFESIQIPKGIKVWYGDRIMFDKLDTYCFQGIRIDTVFGGTTKHLNLQGVLQRENKVYNNYGR